MVRSFWSNNYCATVVLLRKTIAIMVFLWKTIISRREIMVGSEWSNNYIPLGYHGLISLREIQQLLCEAQSWFSEGFPEENWCPNLSQRKRAVFGTFSPLFPEKGQGRDTRKVFRRKTAPFLRDRLGYKFSNKNKEKGQFSFGKVPENLNLVSFQKMVDKKKLFETKNANLTKNAKHFLFQKAFFCQPFFEKTQTLHFLFQKAFFCQPFFEKIQTLHFLFVSWPSLQKGFFLSTIFWKDTFCLCRGPPFKYHFC